MMSVYVNENKRLCGEDGTKLLFSKVSNADSISFQPKGRKAKVRLLE